MKNCSPLSKRSKIYYKIQQSNENDFIDRIFSPERGVSLKKFYDNDEINLDFFNSSQINYKNPYLFPENLRK